MQQLPSQQLPSQQLPSQQLPLRILKESGIMMGGLKSVVCTDGFSFVSDLVKHSNTTTEIER